MSHARNRIFRRTPLAMVMASALFACAAPPLLASDSAPIHVTTVEITGSPAIAAELRTLAASAVGKRMQGAELERLAQRLNDYCASHGYKRIRIILPPQPFEQGVVRFQIVETPYRDPVAVLLEQARLWEGLGRGDLADQSLEKLFRIAPEHPDALAAMTRRHLANNDRDAALKALNQLRKVKPNHPQIPRLADVVRALGADRGKLQQARLLARSGRKKEAVAAWRKLFPNGAPDGDIGMEYWQAVADGGQWQQARSGMMKLVRENPENRRYRLTLAKLEQAHDVVTPETLRLLRHLSSDPIYGRESLAVWRSAIIALPASRESAAQMREFLARDPNDSGVRDRLAQWSRADEEEQRNLQDPAYRAKLAGIALLDQEKNEEAAAQFAIALAGRPDDVDALGGMGIAQLRLGQHGKARGYFQRALERDAENSQKWSSLLRTASFWGLMRESADARDAGDIATAERKVREALAIDPQQPDALVRLADLHVAQQQEREAEQRYRDALAAQPNHAGAYEGLLALYLRAGREEEARLLIASAPLPQQAALQRDVDRMRGRQQRQSADELIAAGRIDEAIVALQRSLAAERSAAGGELSAIRASESGAELRVDARTPKAADNPYPYRQLARMLDQRTDWIHAAVDWHQRDGTPGESRIDLVEVPVEWRHPWRANETIFARADVVSVNAGTVARDNDTFGTQWQCAANASCPPGDSAQRAAGVSLAAGYVGSRLRADLGTTPLGFPVTNIVGGIESGVDLGPFSLSAELSRRPLTSSLLAFAGTHDTVTGRVWGGVVATGVRFGLSADQGGAFGFWSSLGAHQLTGMNVIDNDRVQLMAGGYWRAINEEDRLLSIGLTGMAWRMSKNAGEYSFGHGGYYSPQEYFSLSLPVTWAQRFTRFSYALRGSVSTSWSKSSDADYFPTSSDYQSQSGLRYAASPWSGGGIGYSFSGAAEYQWAPDLFVGGRFEIDRSDNYAPNRVLFYLRKSLGRAAAQPVPLNPDPMIPYSQF